MSKTDETDLEEEKEAFTRAMEAADDNRNRFLESIRFSRLGDQWPEKFRQQRELDGKPVITINHQPSFIRQVVNDARQNKPQIVIKPTSGGSTKATANVIGGIVRNIEYQSKANIAYDTAVDNAASGNVGYIRVDIDYEYDDSFDKCLRIKPIANPLSVYPDPDDLGADSSNWNSCFVTDLMTKDEFEATYPGEEVSNWEIGNYDGMTAPWRQDDTVLLAESWKREKVKRKIFMLSNQMIVGEDEYTAGQDYFMAMGIQPVNERDSLSMKVTQRIMTGGQILSTNDWVGRYIPVVPCYGEQVIVEGKMQLFSLVHHAMDAQRMFNYFRSNAAELAGLLPRVPYIGEEGAFDVDPEKWNTVNTQNHSFLEVARGKQMPQRQPLDTSAGVTSLTQAGLASDDMKAIIGLYDASLGHRSNETSGVAINARKHEGDVSTFHFQDNLSRCICHLGTIIVDLIPKVYSERQMVRIIGVDGQESAVKIGQAPPGQPPEPPPVDPLAAIRQNAVGSEAPPVNSDPNMHPNGYGDQQGSPVEHVYDLGLGKYDVAVDTGPSFTTKREETSKQMQEVFHNFPQALPYVGDLLVKAMDWPNSEEMAKRLNAMLPQQVNGGPSPEQQKMMEQAKQQQEQSGKQIQQLTQQSQAMTQQTQQLTQQIQAEKIKSEIEKRAADLQAQDFQLQLEAKDLQIQQMKAIDNVRKATEAHMTTVESSQNAMQPEPPAPPPDIMGSVVPAIADAITQGVSKALSGNPPVRMKRTAVRDKNGMILHTIDEPMPMTQAPMPNTIQ